MRRYIDTDLLKDKTTRVNNIWNVTTNAEGKGLDEIIDDIPPADVRENVKGRWVEVVDRTEMYDKEGVKTWGMLFQCNQCGFVLNAIECHTGQYNYCPNCGAEMGGKS